jgi:hypothetical protein
MFFPFLFFEKQKNTMIMRYKHVVVIYKFTTKGRMNFKKNQAPKNDLKGGSLELSRQPMMVEKGQ